MKTLIALLVLVCGCGGSNIPALSMTPDDSFVSPIQQAARTLYGDHIIHVEGVVGHFKLVLKNTSDQTLTDVNVAVSANDPNKVSDIIFSRIYHELFWGGGLFNFDGMPTLPDGSLLPLDVEAAIPNPSQYSLFQGDDLEPNNSVSFDSIVLGESGLMLYFQAYASLPDGTHYALPIDATSVQWRY